MNTFNIEAFIEEVEGQLPDYDDGTQLDVYVPIQRCTPNEATIAAIRKIFFDKGWTEAAFQDDRMFYLSRKPIPVKPERVLPGTPYDETEARRLLEESVADFVTHVNEVLNVKNDGVAYEIAVPIPVKFRSYNDQQRNFIRTLYFQRGWKRVEFDGTLLRLYRVLIVRGY